MGSTNKHQIGDSVGRYRLVREAGEGFPGPLWTVESSADGVAALGLARVYSFPDDVEHAIRENLGSSAWDAMEVDHVAVAKAADVVFEESEFATIYDYVDGLPLNMLMRLAASRKAPFPANVALRITCDLLSGLDALRACADTLGVSGVHGGLVPDACFVARHGRTLLLDAFVAGPAATYPALLRIKDRVGYVAPEQFQGLPADARSDVYTAGCILWELVANRRLHLGGVATVERNITRGQLLSLRAFASGEPPGFEQLVSLVAKATHLDPSERYPTPSALREALMSISIDVAEAPDVARFVSALGDLDTETKEEAKASTSLRDALLAQGVGPSRARSSRRTSAPPSLPEEPVPSSLESRVDFEIPPPFPPPEPPPLVIIEPLPQAPRVPDLALLEVALAVQPPPITLPVATPAVSVASGAEGESRAGSRDGSQSQSKVVPPSSPVHAIPRVHKKQEPTLPGSELKGDAMKKALGTRSTLLGPTAISPSSGDSSKLAVPRAKVLPAELPKFSATRAPKKPTMMGLGVAAPQAQAGVAADPKDPAKSEAEKTGPAIAGSAPVAGGAPGPATAGAPGKPASDDEATSISPPPLLDDFDARPEPQASADPVAETEKPILVALLPDQKQLDSEMFATPARETAGVGTTSPLTWILGASTAGLSIVVAVLLMRTPVPPTHLPAPSSIGDRALGHGRAVSPTVPSPVSPASAPPDPSAHSFALPQNTESASLSSGGANSAVDAVPAAAARPRAVRRAPPASKGPKFVPVDL